MVGLEVWGVYVGSDGYLKLCNGHRALPAPGKCIFLYTCVHYVLCTGQGILHLWP